MCCNSGIGDCRILLPLPHFVTIAAFCYHYHCRILLSLPHFVTIPTIAAFCYHYHCRILLPFLCDAPAFACMDSLTADGKVPDLRNLTALITLDLSNNNLEGPVPESLVNHPSLQILNMSNNHLNGALPIGQSNSSLNIADFSHNSLTLTTVDLPSVRET
jgi:hypothetical protein